MDRATFLRRAGLTVAALSLGRLPAPAAAAPGVEYVMYPEGSWLFIDGGQMELGIVRDSVLNVTNEYQIFAESLDNVRLGA